MNYYNEIKNELINNEITKRVKDYSKNRSDLKTYYNVGKLLSEAGKHYGEGIIEKYSNRLVAEVGKRYNKRTLFRMRQFYNIFSKPKMSPLATQLTWSHYIELLSLKEENKILYYLKISIEENLSRNNLRSRIHNKEYERLDEKVRNKLVLEDKSEVIDFVKNPILIKKHCSSVSLSEKVLKKLILEDIDNFLLELGHGFSYISNEYKIKIGDVYNYIDLLLYNIEFNCYVVIELKVTELKKEHIGQIEIYMNYVDHHLRKINQEKTIGIIICKKDNQYIIEYCSDRRIIARTYEFV